MQFFQHFPKIDYLTTEVFNGVPQVISRSVPNMTVKLLMDILDNADVEYETYRIKDGDRPDTVAAQLYGNARYAWIIILANKMRDIYDWPLTDAEFNDYMSVKYESSTGAGDGVSESSNTIHYYIWITDDGRELSVDEDFYLTLPAASKRTITTYEHEYEENDERRLIRVIPLSSVQSVVDLFDKAVAS